MRHPGLSPSPVLPQWRRRWLLTALLAGGWLGWLARADAAQGSTPRRPPARWPDAPPAALIALVDHLLPADDMSPAASALKVPEALWREARADVGLTAFVWNGCSWLDRYGEGFASLEEAEREALCQWMAKAGWDTAQRRFFHWVRERAVTRYYSHPASWRGMPFERPPQPLGFPEV